MHREDDSPISWLQQQMARIRAGVATKFGFVQFGDSPSDVHPRRNSAPAVMTVRPDVRPRENIVCDSAPALIIDCPEIDHLIDRPSNSVGNANHDLRPPCRRIQKKGVCENGDQCEFRHEGVEMRFNPGKHERARDRRSRQDVMLV